MANDPLMLNKGERIVAMVEIVKMKNGKPSVVKIDGVEYAMKKGRNGNANQ